MTMMNQNTGHINIQNAHNNLIIYINTHEIMHSVPTSFELERSYKTSFGKILECQSTRSTYHFNHCESKMTFNTRINLMEFDFIV